MTSAYTAKRYPPALVEYLRGHGRKKAGFTMIEILVSLVVLTIGMAGVLSLSQTSSSAVGYARHATEAAIAGEDKLEVLRMTPSTQLASGADTVDERGTATQAGLFARRWQIAWTGTLATVVVSVSWSDGGSVHQINYRTMRGQ